MLGRVLGYFGESEREIARGEVFGERRQCNQLSRARGESSPAAVLELLIRKVSDGRGITMV